MNTTNRIVVGAIVASIALLAFAIFVQRYVQRTRALAPEVKVTLTPLGEGRFSLLVKPAQVTNKISIMDLTLMAEGGEVATWDTCTAPDNDKLAFIELGKKTGAKARYSCSLIKDTAQLPNSVILTGRATCSGSAKSVKLALDKSSAVGGPVEGVQYALKLPDAVTVPCDGGAPEPEHDVRISFESTPHDGQGCSIEIGGRCSMNVREEVRLPNAKLSAVYLKLAYDNALLEVLEANIDSGHGKPTKLTSRVLGEMTKRYIAQTNSDPSTITGIPTLVPEPITPTATPSPTVTQVPTTTPSASPTSVLTPTQFPSPTEVPTPKEGCDVYYALDTQAGEVEFLHVCAKPTEKLSSFLTQVVGFKGLVQGKGRVQVVSVQAIGPRSLTPGSAKLYTVNKPSEQVTVGGPKAQVKLDMRLRLQCVVKQPKGSQKLNVRVGVADGKLKKPIYETAEFTADAQGFWNGTVAFNVPEGSQYKLLVKGDKHMQKKICDTAPQEDYPGAYRCDKGRVTLKDGTQFVDLSKIILVTGDLPPGEQDGISNAKDQSLVRNLIGKTDPESAKLADINFDGVVNAVDHSCMIAALSVRWDEE